MSFESAGYQLLPVLPELVLAAGAMVLLMLGAYRGSQTTGLITGLAVCLLVIVGALELLLPAGKLTTFGGSFIVDDFARFLKILALIGSAATLILSTEFLSNPGSRIFEYAILVLLSTLGMMVLISAGDLIMLYLGLELMSLAQWQQIVVFVSIASMLLGSFAAIGQKNIKRLMAYSSIGHMGFALVGLAAGTVDGAQGVLVYISIYVAMTLGSFAVILTMKRNGLHVENISDFSGLSRTNPLLATIFAMLLFSLSGIPPLAGFFAKFYVFTAAIHAGLFTLAVVGVLASVVGAFYYLNIIKVMFFDEPIGVLDPMRIELRSVLTAAVLFHIMLIVYPGPLVSVASVAAKSLF
jgi:NADH:ubiquinone oxidoreductase subunit 2 (subunit N)